MNQKHLFIIDPLEKLNPALDSSLRMAVELQRLGHEVFMTEVPDMSWDSRWEKGPVCLASLLSFDKGLSPGSARAEPVGQRDLREFHGIHMRKEPPFDMSYIAVTWFLDAVADSCLIFNAPAALRAFNEKVAILRYPGDTDPVLLTRNLQEAKNFIVEACKGDAIIKPLDLYGGKGIFRVQVGDSGEGPSAWGELATALEEGLRLIQPFNHAIAAGEVRVFTLAGKPLNWVLKKPAPGSYFANTSAGATLHPYTPSPALEAKITRIATELFRHGVALTGFDVIGEQVSEINITSPRLLQPEDDTTNYYEVMAKWFEKQCVTSGT